MVYSGAGSVSPSDAGNSMMELWVGDCVLVSWARVDITEEMG